jgi:hypothetical protein
VDLDVSAWDLSCELLHVEEAGDSLLLDAVTLGPSGDGDDAVPAGWPVTWWIINPTSGSGNLASDLQDLVRGETGCRIGMVSWMGKDLLVATGRDDCVVVLLTSVSPDV